MQFHFTHTHTHTHTHTQILFHCAGIVMLTLIVNATSTKYLLKALGMSDVSHATRVTMAQGHLHYHEQINVKKIVQPI